MAAGLKRCRTASVPWIQIASDSGACDGLYLSADLPPNINFFVNVPVTPTGGLEFADGISAPGRYVQMRANMDVLVLNSNCPQLNNPVEQPLQRLQSNTDSNHDLGGGLNIPSDRGTTRGS
jgi:hypothetical protein